MAAQRVFQNSSMKYIKRHDILASISDCLLRWSRCDECLCSCIIHRYITIRVQKESEKSKTMRDVEEKLITSAFYNFVSNIF